jgi:addiction module RelB/DinJ family antitoxin
MPKDASISIRMDSQLKEKAEYILDQFGLNMTVVINMLFHQIVRDQSIPLSLSLNPKMNIADELYYAKKERESGYSGRVAENVIDDIERIINEAEYGAKKV